MAATNDRGPLGGLESPFLDGELAAGPDREQWLSRLGFLEAETPFLGELEDEAPRPCPGIIGDDDRRPVRQAWDVPHRWICQIWTRRTKGGKPLKPGPVGTGVLISPRFVLTAAHLLHHSERDQRNQFVDSVATEVWVTPALNSAAPSGREQPFGRYKARTWHLSPRYNPRGADSRRFDFAVIELEQFAGAKRTALLNNQPLCFWGSRQCGSGTVLEVLPANQVGGRMAFTAGYPDDLGGGTRPHVTSGTLRGVDIPGRREIMNYDADGCHGQSGSPIWIERDGRRFLVGIFTFVGAVTDATTGRITGNEAVRITQDVFDQISRWLEAVMETPWLEAPEPVEPEVADEWSETTDDAEAPVVALEELSTVEDERGDDSEVFQLDESATGPELESADESEQPEPA